ncbi:MAG: hypothetical protein ACYS8Z_15780 [Planctomycetota bacterium]|jgi:hypothetical protein
MKRRTAITIACLIIALCIWLIVYFCTAKDSSRFTVVSNGPLKMRLWGIRPDAGDAIYDPNGEKIMEILGLNRWEKTVWENTLYRHDLIFEMLDVCEPVTFYRGRYFADGEEIPRGRWIWDDFAFDYEGRKLRWFQTTFARTVRKPFLFGAWKRDIPVDKIDLSFQYFYGPPRSPICVFKGPFAAGAKISDETGLYEISFVPHPDPSRTELVLRCRAKQGIAEDARALFYHVRGRRYYTMKGWQAGKWKPGKPTRKELLFAIPSIRLESTAMITVGEEPFEITFKNLNLTLFTSEHRHYAEHLDRIAERLDPKHSATRWDQHHFRDPNEALKVVDVIRGKQIYKVCSNLWWRRNDEFVFDPSTMNAEQSQRLKQAALAWSKAIDPDIREQAMRLGLHCGWPEFVDIALDILDCPHRNSSNARDAADALEAYKRNLSEQNIERIAEALSKEDDTNVIYRLQRCLEYPKSPARVIAMWALADHDRPWLYVPAIRYLDSWRELDGKHDSLPERFKIRVFLIAGPDGFSDPNEIAPKASALLLALLSDQLLSHHSGTFTRLLTHVPESIDRKAVTTAIAESLRGMEYRGSWSIWEAIDRSVRHLNHWHGINIGGLGSDIRKMTPDLNRLEFEAIAAEAIEWYDSEYKTSDANVGD